MDGLSNTFGLGGGSSSSSTSAQKKEAIINQVSLLFLVLYEKILSLLLDSFIASQLDNLIMRKQLKKRGGGRDRWTATRF